MKTPVKTDAKPKKDAQNTPSVDKRSAIQKRSSLRSSIGAMVMDICHQQMLSSLVECDGQGKDDGGNPKKISVDELRSALNNCMEAFDLIPTASRYGSSRKACIKKCLERLEECETSGEHDLAAWMKRLNLE